MEVNGGHSGSVRFIIAVDGIIAACRCGPLILTDCRHVHFVAGCCASLPIPMVPNYLA